MPQHTFGSNQLYGDGNRFLIPGYQIYAQEPYASELKKDFLATAIALLPFDLEAGQDFEFFNQKFIEGIALWSDMPADKSDPRSTLDYWINQADYIGEARQRMLNNPGEQFVYLDEAEIAKLNQVLRRRGLYVPAAPAPRPAYPDAALLNSWRQTQR